MLLGELGLFKLVQTFWGLAVLIGLGGYSVYEAGQPAGVASSASSRSDISAAVALSTVVIAPRATPIGGFPTPSPLTIFLACDGADGDSVRYYVPSPGGYVVLRTDVDRDLVVKVLAGESTQFSANANVVHTPCVRGLIRSGRLP